MGGLSAARKAAIVLLSLDQDDAARIMKNLSPDILEKITNEIWFLDDVSDEDRQVSATELAERVSSNALVGGADVAKALLVEVVGADQAKELIEKAKKEESSRKAFASLLGIKSKDLANFLNHEQPSTISIIMGFLPTEKIAEILAELDEDLRSEIIIRLASPTQANPEIIKRIEQVFIRDIVEKISNKDQEGEKDIGGPSVVAEVIQNMDRDIGDTLMGAIQEHSQEIATDIAQRLFTFEDIVGLGDADIQRLMRDVPMEKLPLALKSTEPELFDKFAGNLSKRAKENLIEEMDLMGKIKLSEVQEAQREIVAIVRSLEAAGEITLAIGGEEDEYV